LVVISIIAILSSVVLASLASARGKARDSRRIQDLTQIRTALVLYFEKFGNWMQTGSGCGAGGSGNGWFNYVGPSYPISMGQCLVDNGFTATEIIDPTGGKTSSPSSGFTYMKYTCGAPPITYIYAKLESEPQSPTATDGTCYPSCDSSYGMNRYLLVN
jgi:type II secretory pathway pseudopilin PulG